jgi:hypothetical protein
VLDATANKLREGYERNARWRRDSDQYSCRVDACGSKITRLHEELGATDLRWPAGELCNGCVENRHSSRRGSQGLMPASTGTSLALFITGDLNPHVLQDKATLFGESYGPLPT